MENKQAFHLSIPEPCFENWNDMTPAEQGRHCSKCDKVVRDFSGCSKEEITDVVRGSSAQVCGRVPAKHVTGQGLRATTFFRFPIQRLRVFLVAFVAVFGLEVWGISKAEAQVAKPHLEVLESDSGRKKVAKKRQGKYIRLKGKVLEYKTGDPLEEALVSVIADGEIISGSVSNGKGEIELRIPRYKLKSETFDLMISWYGMYRMEKGVPSDAEEIVIYADGGLIVEGGEITAKVPLFESFGYGSPGYLTGQLIVEPCVRAPAKEIHFQGAPQTIYRPLDEWMMMNNSEIHHSGR